MALIQIGFFSEVLGMSVQCDVILPQKASGQIGMAAVKRGEKHPVLWLLHGASDDHTIWQRRTSIERYAAPLGLAVVMPAAHLSSYEDMAHGGKFYTYIVEELPRVMRSFFPLSDERQDNYICGLSMGGTGSLKIGLKNPEKYAAIGCLSAGITDFNRFTQRNEAQKRRMEIVFGDRNLELLGEQMRDDARNLVKAGGPIPRVYHACGAEDFLIDTARKTRDFFQGLEGNPFDYVYQEGPGAHTWEYWDDKIQRFFEYLDLSPVENIRN